jgi:RNA polymerase sigma-70 factor (ECF subfamily)
MSDLEQGDAEEQQQLDLIKAGDPDALARYFDNHRNELTGFIRSITGEHLLTVVELDDLIQEVATTAITGLPTAPLDQYSPMQWLQQIARRRVADAHRFHFGAQRRDAGRQKSLHGGSGGDASAMGIEQWLVASMTSPSAAVSRDVRMDRMTSAISELGKEQQDAIRMRYVEGMSTKAIAEKLGKTDVATRVLLSRSMRQLEKLLEDVRPDR